MLASVVHLPNSVALYLGFLFFWDWCSLRGPIVTGLVVHLGLLFFTWGCLSSVVHLPYSVDFYLGLLFFWDCGSLPGAALLYLGLFMVFSWVCPSCFISVSVVHLKYLSMLFFYLGLLFFQACCSFLILVVIHPGLLFTFLGLFFTETWARFFAWICCSLPWPRSVVLRLSPFFFTGVFVYHRNLDFFTCSLLYLGLLFITWALFFLPGSVVLNPVILYLLITAQVLMSEHFIEIFKKTRL